MIIVANKGFEQALKAFTEQSGPILKEAKRHAYFTPESNRRHHRGKKRSGKHTGRKCKYAKRNYH